MKKILLFSATIGIGSLALTSNSGGPGAAGNGNRTGSTGTAANCSSGGCHSASSAKTTGTFAIRVKSSSAVVTDGKYLPGTVYVVTLAGINTTLLSKFGFQATVTKADKSLAGTLTATAAGTAVRTSLSPNVIEHSSTRTGTSGAYSVEFDWTAPAKGAGTVTFYGIINAVNGNSSQDSGDEPSNGFTLSLTEGTPASIAAAPVNSTVKIFPNPCSNYLTVEGLSAKTFTARVADLAGRVIINAQSEGTIDVAALQNGIYVLTITTDAGQQTSTFVKQ